jgi:hypothetical protein
MKRIVWHEAAQPWQAEQQMRFPGWYQKCARTKCGRFVPLYLIGNPGDDPDDDCKQCARIAAIEKSKGDHPRPLDR